MKQHIRLFCLIAGAVLCSCSSKPPPLDASKIPPTRGVGHRWEGRDFDRVVGYRFVDFEWTSLIRYQSNELDIESLQRGKRNEAILSGPETEQLMDAIFGAHPKSDAAMCYQPHHIFIFFAKDQPIGAFEICFQCLQSRAWPKNNLNVNESFAKLAALCKQLGLGVKPPLR
ncbi:MAG: hypothetical protein U1F71_14650 [Verrucomicrobiaceae bacterium]